MLNGECECGKGNRNRLVANVCPPILVLKTGLCVINVFLRVCACAHRGRDKPFVLEKVLINNVGCFE